jgi:hypothetical protein
MPSTSATSGPLHRVRSASLRGIMRLGRNGLYPSGDMNTSPSCSTLPARVLCARRHRTIGKLVLRDARYGLAEPRERGEVAVEEDLVELGDAEVTATPAPICHKQHQLAQA